MSDVRGVIFDVDGTLIDSNDAHAHAWETALAQNGFDVPYATLRGMIGMGGDKIVPLVTGLGADDDEVEKLGKDCDAIFEKVYAPTLHAFPDVRALFERMKSSGLGLFIATSAKEQQLDELLRIANIKDLLSDTSSKNPSERSKPDPDIVHAAVVGSGLPESALLMVGDTPYDMEAATRARVRPIGVRSGGWTDHDLVGAVVVYDGVWSMLARIRIV